MLQSIDIIKYLKDKLTIGDENMKTYDFIPYYEGFKGSIRKINDEKFLIKGIYEKIGVDTIRITELPLVYGLMILKNIWNH